MRRTKYFLLVISIENALEIWRTSCKKANKIFEKLLVHILIENEVHDSIKNGVHGIAKKWVHDL